MFKRRRFKQTTTLEARLAIEARQLREDAARLPPGVELLRKARQNETASHISDWLRSPGLEPPSR